ncbi:Arrestin red cell isoform 2, partial [Geodia barretti]
MAETTWTFWDSTSDVTSSTRGCRSTHPQTHLNLSSSLSYKSDFSRNSEGEDRNASTRHILTNRGLPSSVSLSQDRERLTTCGLDFILRCFIGKLPEDKIEKRNSVRLAIKKITHAPEEQTQRPTTDVSKDFMLSSHPLLVEANLDKGTYSHGEPIKVNISIANRSSKTVKKIRVQVRQFASICLFAQSEYKCVVAQVDSE